MVRVGAALRHRLHRKRSAPWMIVKISWRMKRKEKMRIHYNHEMLLLLCVCMFVCMYVYLINFKLFQTIDNSHWSNSVTVKKKISLKLMKTLKRIEINYASLFWTLLICATRSEQPLLNPTAAGKESGEPLMPQLLSSSSSPRWWAHTNPGWWWWWWWWWCPAPIRTPLYHQRLHLVPLSIPELFPPPPLLLVPSLLLLVFLLLLTGKGRHWWMDSESPPKQIPKSTPPPCLAPIQLF